MRVNEAFHEAARGVWSDRASGTSRGVRRGVLRSSRGRRTLEVWLDPGRARGGTQGVAQREGVAQRGVREGVPVHGWAISLGKHAGIVQARPASDGFCSGDLAPPVGIRQVALARILRTSPSVRRANGGGEARRKTKESIAREARTSDSSPLSRVTPGMQTAFGSRARPHAADRSAPSPDGTTDSARGPSPRWLPRPSRPALGADRRPRVALDAPPRTWSGTTRSRTDCRRASTRRSEHGVSSFEGTPRRRRAELGDPREAPTS